MGYKLIHEYVQGLYCLGYLANTYFHWKELFERFKSYGCVEIAYCNISYDILSTTGITFYQASLVGAIAYDECRIPVDHQSLGALKYTSCLFISRGFVWDSSYFKNHVASWKKLMIERSFYIQKEALISFIIFKIFFGRGIWRVASKNTELYLYITAYRFFIHLIPISLTVRWFSGNEIWSEIDLVLILVSKKNFKT